MSRPHCTCLEVRNYRYPKAAEKLGVPERFLRDRISRLPHQRMGENVVFCDCDLRVVQRMFTVIPDEVWELLTPITPEPQPAPAPSLRSIKPAGAHRPRATAVSH
jgi:hypothetical protein